MSVPTLNTQIRLFDSLPRQVQSAVVGYANAAQLPPSVVIEFAIAQFLELESENLEGHLSSIEEGSILSELPPFIQVGIEHYALESEMPPEFVVELAISHFLDPDSVTFDDCQVSIQRARVEQLKTHWHDRQAIAA
jgi:predicted transcriptional regulator